MILRADTQVKRPSHGYDEMLEWRKCKRSVSYFIDNYCWIYDAEAKQWIPFNLWKEQFQTLQAALFYQLLVALKARQVGLTWLFLCLELWLMIFWPISTILNFSKRDDEAVYLQSEERLRGVYRRLPDWMKAHHIAVDNDHVFMLSNGSIARAFPTSAGDSYTATFALVDEADLVPDLPKLLGSVKPTIDAGGKLALISRADKSKPNSRFKKIYRAAKAGSNSWHPIFLPWWVRPSRDKVWYAEQKKDSLENTGSLDELFEQYPATDKEALAPRTLDKRIPPAWINQCHVELDPIENLPPDAPNIPGLVVYRLPGKAGIGRFVGGLDCAEGLPTSDDSATTFVSKNNGEEVANLVGKFTPAMHAAYSAQIAAWYNNAALMVENNNHGHAAILWLMDNTRIALLEGHNGKTGWSSSTLGKVILYTETAEAFKMGETIIHDFETLTQLQSIDKSTLRAPPGQLDDRADSYALAIVACSAPVIEEIYDDSMRVNIGWN